MLMELNKSANSIHHSFNEVEKIARAEARAAIKARDRQRWKKIRAERRRAGDAVNEILDILEDQAMSTAVQKEIAVALGNSTTKARDLVSKMKTAGKVLDTVAKFANLMVGILGTVRAIAGVS